MSDLNPTGPSQPSLNDAYTTPGNAASKDPSEAHQTAHRSLDDSEPVDRRVPTKQAEYDQAVPSSMGRGIRGAGAGEESKGLSEEDVGRHQELDAQQMAAPGEGDVADAVAGRGSRGGALSGGGGEQPDLAADLDRKKEEQREAREAIQQQRQSGGMGQRSAPADPTENDNYPNSNRY